MSALVCRDAQKLFTELSIRHILRVPPQLARTPIRFNVLLPQNLDGFVSPVTRKAEKTTPPVGPFVWPCHNLASLNLRALFYMPVCPRPRQGEITLRSTRQSLARDFYHFCKSLGFSART